MAVQRGGSCELRLRVEGCVRARLSITSSCTAKGAAAPIVEGPFSAAKAGSKETKTTGRHEGRHTDFSCRVARPPMKVHDLRSMYMYTACVYHLYETDLPLNTVAQAILGHGDLEESLS